MGYLASQMDFRPSDDLGGYASARPPSFEVYRHFRAGHELFVQGDYRAALSHFNNAIAQDSSFEHALVVAAIAHRNLGEFAESELYVELLERQRESLSPSTRAWTDYLRASSAGDRAGMLRAVRRAVDASPYPFSFFQLGAEALRVNRPREAIHALGQIRSESYLAAWRLHWTVLAWAHHLLGEYARELEVVGQGQTHFADDLWLRSSELQALAALGRTREVLDRLDEVFTLRGDLPTALHDLALELTAHGHADAATQVLLHSVAWQRSRPAAEAGTPSARFRLGRDLLELGQTAEARRLFEALVREAPENLTFRAYVGLAAARAGERAAAAEAMSWLAALERPYLFGAHLYQQAQIAAELGERERAVALLRDALAQGRPYGVDVHRSPHLRSLRGYPPFEEMLRPKG